MDIDTCRRVVCGLILRDASEDSAEAPLNIERAAAMLVANAGLSRDMSDAAVAIYRVYEFTGAVYVSNRIR